MFDISGEDGSFIIISVIIFNVVVTVAVVIAVMVKIMITITIIIIRLIAMKRQTTIILMMVAINDYIRIITIKSMKKKNPMLMTKMIALFV